MVSYKVKATGAYHSAKAIPCQDAYSICVVSDDVLIGAVTDGLGSERFSDRGAKITANISVNEVSNNYSPTQSVEEKLCLIKDSFAKAYSKVIEVAKKQGNNIDQYDCTLCLCILEETTGDLYYGQSGDSGLIVSKRNGTYEVVTKQQRDEEGYVYPLCAGPEYWEVGIVQNVVGAMLLTDGILDLIVPENTKCLNEKFLNRMMDHYEIGKGEVKRLEREAQKFIENIPRQVIYDDKTMVVLLTANKPSSSEISEDNNGHNKNKICGEDKGNNTMVHHLVHKLICHFLRRGKNEIC